MVLGWLVLGLASLWSVAALYFDVRTLWLRLPVAALYGLGMVATLFVVCPVEKRPACKFLGQIWSAFAAWFR
jgi:hypothetical protein